MAGGWRLWAVCEVQLGDTEGAEVRAWRVRPVEGLCERR